MSANFPSSKVCLLVILPKPRPNHMRRKIPGNVWGLIGVDTVDERNPAPLDLIRGLSYYFRSFIHPNGGLFRISEPSTVVTVLLRGKKRVWIHTFFGICISTQYDFQWDTPQTQQLEAKNHPTLRLHGMSWGVETTCFKAPGVSLGGSGVSIGGVRSLREGRKRNLVDFHENHLHDLELHKPENKNLRGENRVSCWCLFAIYLLST